MRPRLWMLATVAVLPGLVAVGVAGARAGEAHDRARMSLANLQALADGANELTVLRASVPTWVQATPGGGSGSGGGLTQSVTGTLERCGLRPAVLENLSPDPEPQASGAAGPTVQRRGASLVLSDLTLPQLGTFLAAWREREPRWTVAKIDLAPMPRRSEPAGGDLPVRAVLGLEFLAVFPGAVYPGAAVPGAGVVPGVSP